MSSTAAISDLLEANQSYAKGLLGTPKKNELIERRIDLAKNGQSPKVTVLACADSRVAPEVLFNKSLGELFVIRIAGNVATSEAIASIEYAVSALKTELVVVLGHSNCGAVGGALEVEPGCSEGSCLDGLLSSISKDIQGESSIEGAVAKNVKANIEKLNSSSSIIKEAAANGDIQLVGAVYDLESGIVKQLSN
jgi:carbonic anhydrase